MHKNALNVILSTSVAGEQKQFGAETETEMDSFQNDNSRKVSVRFTAM